MSSVKFKLFANSLLACALVLFFFPQALWAYKAADFNWIPPILAKNEKPSVHIILDNSGSMLGRAFTGSFTPSNEYYGYFDSKKYYKYTSDSGGYFYPSTSTTGVWNGNFLNWACMHRVDVARKVLTGGTYSHGTYWINSQDWSNRVSSFSYDDSTKKTDLNGNSRYMTPFSSKITNIDHKEGSSSLTLKANWRNYSYSMRVQETQKTGVLHNFKEKTRLSLFNYRSDNGGKIVQYMGDTEEGFTNIINKINTTMPSSWTPLAETLYTAIGYIKQDNNKSDYGPRYADESYSVSKTNDPYYFAEFDEKVYCTDQSVILITDGLSTQDQNIPNSIKNLIHPKPHTYTLESNGSPYLIDVAYYGHTTDLRPDIAGKQTMTLYTVFAFGTGGTLLSDAALYGGFKDEDGNGIPTAAEYDKNSDGVPDNYFEAQSGQELEAGITTAMQDATQQKASGTMAAVAPAGRAGEGAMYQALFYPPSGSDTPVWGGQVHAFLIDSLSNLREDTDNDQCLSSADKYLEFGEADIYRYTDTNADGYLDEGEKNSTEEDLVSMSQLAYLWNTSEWLNSLTDAEAASQRVYASSTKNRYILTFADIDGDMVADTGEVQDFVLSAKPATSSLNSPDFFYNYLSLYETRAGGFGLDATIPAQNKIKTLQTASPDNFANFQAELAQRQVNYIRGVDVGDATIEGIEDYVRSRTQNGTTWRLGDIINSTPTVVGSPSENYHGMYKDTTYRAFYKKYSNRRHMVYTGANDGMLHAFNGGFYNSTSKGFSLTSSGETAFPLGMEMWAYIPYNLLPHLRWLMDPEYGKDLHAAYMDLKPRIFDARIFVEADGITSTDNSTYPNGWGTVMVTGMRLGGARIEADIDKTDGDAFNASIDRVMSSAYVIMDITNPEAPPKVLGEITMPELGFSTCYPTVMPMSEKDSTTGATNHWYLVFGSGPANAQGHADSSKLSVETSAQAGKLYVLDLRALAADKKIVTLDSSGTFSEGNFTFSSTEPGSFIADPIAVDLDLGSSNQSKAFKTDVIYYGTATGDQTNARGRMCRLLTDNELPSVSQVNWTANSTLFDAQKPITGAAAVATDDEDNLWVYFGTGRFYNRDDIPQNHHMSFFGIKEPASSGTKTWATVSADDLYNSSTITLNGDSCVPGHYDMTCVQVIKTTGGISSTLTWDVFETEVSAKQGWRQDFTDQWERSISQAVVSGGAVMFTTYLPSNDICTFDGTSKLWGVYYKTGTQYYKPIFPTNEDVFSPYVDLGKGQASSPSLHVSDKKEASIFVGTSTGSILKYEVDTPLPIKSGVIFWEKR